MPSTRTAGPAAPRRTPLVGDVLPRRRPAPRSATSPSARGSPWSTRSIEYKEGGVNDFVHKLRGRAKFPNLVLKRGITARGGFTKWFVGCREKTERRELTLTMFDHDAQAGPDLVVRGRVPGQVDRPGLQGAAGRVAIETLEIAHQGLKSVRLRGAPWRSPTTSPRPTSRSRAASRSTAGSTRPSTRSPRRNKWKVEPVVGAGAARPPSSAAATPQKLTLDLLFDAADHATATCAASPTPCSRRWRSTRRYASGKNSGRPPTIEFGWGSTTTFKAVCDSLTVQFTLFRPNGTPVRAKAKISLLQAGADGRQGRRRTRRPGRRPALRTHVVRDGDSLQAIAHQAYGDPTLLARDRRGQRHRRPARLPRGTAVDPDPPG